uniref:Uncharacterized protein n=1 Tax=Aegilops tauschii TaxID=37682 RepID=N1QQN3_AEGTA
MARRERGTGAVRLLRGALGVPTRRARAWRPTGGRLKTGEPLVGWAASWVAQGAPRWRFPAGEMSTNGLDLDGTRGAHIAGWNCTVFQVKSQDSMSAPALETEKAGEAQEAGDGQRYEGGNGQRYEVCSEATRGWTRRLLFASPMMKIYKVD